MTAVKERILHSTEDSNNIEPMMRLKSLILKRYESLLHMIRNLINADNGAVFVRKNIIDNLAAVII